MTLEPIVPIYSGRLIQLQTASALDLDRLAVGYGSMSKARTSDMIIGILEHELQYGLVKPDPEFTGDMLTNYISQFPRDGMFPAAKLDHGGIRLIRQLICFSGRELMDWGIVPKASLKYVREHLHKLGFTLRDDRKCIGCDEYIDTNKARRPLSALCGDCIRTTLHCQELAGMFQVIIDKALELGIYKKPEPALPPVPPKQLVVDTETRGQFEKDVAGAVTFDSLTAVADRFVEANRGGTSDANCDDCRLWQAARDLFVKGDHHGGTKRVCVDRDACHRRSPG